MLKPLSNIVILEQVTESKKKSSIILPDSIEEKKPEIGKVVAVGAGKVQDGKKIPMEVKKGNTVVFQRYGFDKIKIDGKEYLFGSEDKILAIID